MKRIDVAFALLMLVVVLAVVLAAENTSKLWVSVQYRDESDRVIFIQDMETGTRCYAVTNDRSNWSGYAISCVPRQH